MSRIGLGIGSTQNFYNSGLAWTPADITTSAWYDASVTGSITIATGASQWNDLNGTYHLTQGTGANQPASGTRNINGLNALDFDGSNDNLANGTLSDNFEGTDVAFGMYMVFQNDLASQADYIVCMESTSDADPINALRVSGGDAYIGFRRDDANAVLQTASGGTTSTNPAVMNFIFDGTTGSLYANGASLASKNMQLSAVQTFNNFIVGQRTPGNHFNGLIGELIITDGTETTATRQNIEGYLAHKWSLVGSLDGGHPYKVNPPGR